MHPTPPTGPTPPPAVAMQAQAADSTRRTVGARDIALLIGLLAATTILSQFFRAALAVIAPELIHDLSLSPRMLGLANGGFFAALLVAQIAVGVAFDRIGPRRTVGALSIFMTVGAALHAVAYTGDMLVVARVVTGIGCAASFMSALVLVSAWMPSSRWSTGLSWVFGSSQLGILAAGAPLAFVAELAGWRTAFLGTSLLAAMAGALFFTFVRDRPPGAPEPSAKTSSQPGTFQAVRQILALPGLLPVFALFGVAYASVATISGLWAGPYLHDVHGLDAHDRGYVLTIMAAIQMAGVLAFGPLDRWFDTRKWVVAAGAVATLTVLCLLAAIPEPPLWLALTLLFALSASTNYNTVLLAHMRGHFPAHMAGRGSTTGNMAQLCGAALLPVLTGFIPGLVGSTSSGYAPEAYRLIFASLASCLSVGLAIYLRWARDIRPSDRT